MPETPAICARGERLLRFVPTRRLACNPYTEHLHGGAQMAVEGFRLAQFIRAGGGGGRIILRVCFLTDTGTLRFMHS